MIKKRFGILIAFVTLFITGLYAQRPTSLRLNEVLVVNRTNFQDDYGMHSAWIEIYNTSYATVDLKGCFLTNDRNNPTKYAIPKSDVLTKIKPRQHALFWADGMPERGTFHINFTLDPNRDNYIALYDSNGKTLIDEVIIPAGQVADKSYARENDGSEKWVVKGTADALSYVTPCTNNQIIDKNVKIDNFKEHDKIGIGMTITAMTVVFSGLLVLFLSFKLIGSIAIMLGKRNAMKATGVTDKEEAKVKNLGNHSGEEAAAIAMALHEYLNDAHDIENMILTINKNQQRSYSPWSSKTLTLRHNPRR